MSVVYDLVSHGYTAWSYSLIGLAIAIALFALRPIYDRRSQRLLTLMIGVALFVSAAMLIITWDNYHWLRQQIMKGKVRTVDGIVTDFIPEGPGGHPGESFRVDTVTYSYGSYELMPGFRQTMPKGGPIRAGLHVRIQDVDGTIVHLEIAR